MAYSFDRAAAAVRPGDRVMVYCASSSPLGLTVQTVHCSTPGLVYNDEAGFVPDGTGDDPVAVGDVVPAWVLKVRERDGKLDLAFRPPGALPKLEGAASVLLSALLKDQDAGGDGVLPLGDASAPASIKLRLGMSKATFKAARGTLLKAGWVPVLTLPPRLLLARRQSSSPFARSPCAHQSLVRAAP